MYLPPKKFASSFWRNRFSISTRRLLGVQRSWWNLTPVEMLYPECVFVTPHTLQEGSMVSCLLFNVLEAVLWNWKIHSIQPRSEDFLNLESKGRRQNLYHPLGEFSLYFLACFESLLMTTPQLQPHLTPGLCSPPHSCSVLPTSFPPRAPFLTPTLGSKSSPTGPIMYWDPAVIQRGRSWEEKSK